MMRADETAWRAGRFAGRGPRAILFGRMYEDPAIELGVFPAGGRVLCIASAGDTARALAGAHDVVAVDINPVQLEYARQRLAGAPARPGTADRVMDALRRLLPLAGMGRRALEEFLDLDDPAAQAAAWARLATRRFRLGMELLLSLTGLRAVYASPFLEGMPRHLGRVMLARLDRGFSTHANRTNPYARLLLLGAMAGDEAPAPRRVDLVACDVAGYLEGQPAGSFSGFTLSNIFDGAQPGYRARLAAAVQRAGTEEAVVVTRSFREPATAEGAGLAARERSMIWGTVQVTPARTFS